MFNECLTLPIQQIKEYYEMFNGIDGNFSCVKISNLTERQLLHARVSEITTQMSKKWRLLDEIFKINCINTVSLVIRQSH